MSTDERVAMLTVDEARRAAALVGVSEQMADLSVFRILLRNEELAGRVTGLLEQLLWKATLDARLRELIIMRIGWVQGSVYEWTQHWRVARMLEIPEDDLVAVRDWAASDRFDASDRAVLAATDETLQHGAISSTTWDSLVQAVPAESERIEVVLSIANWSMFAQLLRSLRVPLEDGVEAWPPDGVVPPGAVDDVPSHLGGRPAAPGSPNIV